MMHLHVDVHDGSGPYLLLMHGFLSSRAQWAPNLGALSKVCMPVTVELLGHGRSASPPGAEFYSADAYVRAFEGLRRKLGVERWYICGQSFGAGLTIRYAIEHPEHVIGQIFTNSISGLSPAVQGTPEQRARRAAAIETGGRAALEAMPFYPRPSKRLPQEIWQELVRDAGLISPGAVAEAVRTTVPQLSVAGVLRRIAVPTLLVNGTCETAFQPLRDLAVREIANLELVELEGGHSINLDRAEAFNAAVASFIAAHGDDRTTVR